jgi:hypothetical protein
MPAKNPNPRKHGTNRQVGRKIKTRNFQLKSLKIYNHREHRDNFFDCFKKNIKQRNNKVLKFYVFQLFKKLTKISSLCPLWLKINYWQYLSVKYMKQRGTENIAKMIISCTMCFCIRG